MDNDLETNLKNQTQTTDLKSDLADSYKELMQNVLNKKRELFNSRFRIATGELKNYSVFSKLRKEIARINTKISKI